MEPRVDMNALFPERVSVVDSSSLDGSRAGRPDLQAHIASVIDELGRASARAQQLTAPITSASKLQSQKHQLYLLKEGQSSGGRGMAVGFLKVGNKKLFLLDRQGVHVEAEPLCVLDFYIAENLQRHGYGLELFEFMLQHKNVEPVMMAYDRPSPKFLSFLAKHYCLTESVPQVNNFVVFEGFFLNRAAAQLRKGPQRKAEGEIKPYSVMEREAFRREQRTLPWPFAPPHSPQRSVSSQYSQSLSVGSSPSRAPPRVEVPSFPGGSRQPSLPSLLMERSRARRSSRQGQSAKRSPFTRHMDASAVQRLDKHLPGSSEMQPANPALLPPLLPRVSARCASPGVKAGGLTDAVRSLPLRLPPLPQIRAAGPQTSSDGSDQFLDPGGEEEVKLRPRALLEGPAGRSWTVGGSCASAQRARQRQQYRSTRPW